MRSMFVLLILLVVGGTLMFGGVAHELIPHTHHGSLATDQVHVTLFGVFRNSVALAAAGLLAILAYISVAALTVRVAKPYLSDPIREALRRGRVRSLLYE